MGQPQPGRALRQASGRQDVPEEAVTPVIGAVLILAISVLGIAGVLFWGAPTIDRIQASNAQTAMVGEFEDLRDSSRELSVPDHSRFPTVVLPRGELGIAEGTRIMVTATHTSAGCRFAVTGWTDAGNVFGATASGCGSSPTVKAYSVSGQSLVQLFSGSPAASMTATAGTDFSDGDYLFQLLVGTAVVADSWLVSGDRIEWLLGAETGDRAVYLDSGAIFSHSEGSYFLEKAPSIGDSAFGSDYYGLWLRTLSAGNFAAVDGAGTYQVYLSLVGNYVRTDETAVRTIRYDVSGELAESWCNALLARNADLTGASYAEVSGFGCDTGQSGTGVRAVLFSRTGESAFTFRFLHARIYVSLAV